MAAMALVWSYKLQILLKWKKIWYIY